VTIRRVLRTRKKEPEPAESAPPSSAASVGRVRRVRSGAREVKPRYVVDWEASWGAKLQLYLMTSFLYYQMNRSVITNDDYDRLCKELLAGWRTGKHQHKHLVTADDLRAVTGYAIEYPRMVIGGAMTLLDRHQEV